MTLQLWPVLYFQESSTKFNKKGGTVKVSIYDFKWKWVMLRSYWHPLNNKMKIGNFCNSLENQISFHLYLKYHKACCRSVKHFDKHLHIPLCPIFEKESVSGARKKPFEKYAFFVKNNVFHFFIHGGE